MKEFKEFMLERHSCRSYNGVSVEKGLIMQCLDCARLAPPACNSQPWNFVVVTESSTRGKLAELLQILGGNKFSVNAPVLIAVCEEAEPRVMPAVKETYGAGFFAQGDLGAAALAITIQAQELGLSSCIMGTFDNSKVKSLLNIPSDQTVRVVIALGYSDDNSIRPKNRTEISDIVRFVE